MVPTARNGLSSCFLALLPFISAHGRPSLSRHPVADSLRCLPPRPSIGRFVCAGWPCRSWIMPRTSRLRQKINKLQARQMWLASCCTVFHMLLLLLPPLKPWLIIMIYLAHARHYIIHNNSSRCAAKTACVGSVFTFIHTPVNIL